MDVTFFDENGYFVYCSAHPVGDGKWAASAAFERKSDHQKELVPGVRYRITGVVFDSQEKAMQAASQFGLQKARAGEVVFD